MSFSRAHYELCLLRIYRDPEFEALRSLSVEECLALEIEAIYQSLKLCDEGLLDDRSHWMSRLQSYMLYQLKG